MNRHIATVIVAPMTTKGQPYPTRVACHFQGKDGQIVRTVDKTRLVKQLAHLSLDEQKAILDPWLKYLLSNIMKYFTGQLVQASAKIQV